MRISTKTRYGTRAMVDIGEHYGQGPVSLRELAKRQGVSMKYMEQIVPLLKASGLIRSARGAQGGYVLAKEPQEISLHDIVHALVGSWSLVAGARSSTVRCIRSMSFRMAAAYPPEPPKISSVSSAARSAAAARARDFSTWSEAVW